jgi:hypothetical protein
MKNHRGTHSSPKLTSPFPWENTAEFFFIFLKNFFVLTLLSEGKLPFSSCQAAEKIPTHTLIISEFLNADHKEF